MAPHLVRWHEEMKDKGLVVVAIENGERDDLDSIRRWVETDRVPHPVLHDGAAANAALFEVRAYPTAYLVNRSGKVVWEGVPLRDLAGLEKAIRANVGA